MSMSKVGMYKPASQSVLELNDTNKILVWTHGGTSGAEFFAVDDNGYMLRINNSSRQYA